MLLVWIPNPSNMAISNVKERSGYVQKAIDKSVIEVGKS